MTTIALAPYEVALFAPPSPDGRVAYLVGGAEEGAAVWALLTEPKPALAVVDGVDWDRELSPWPAPRAFRSGADFAGGAAAFLAALTGHVVPAVEGALGAASARELAGYSLAGLFAVWAAWTSDVFGRIASVSGSMWYDGFADFLRDHNPMCVPERAYFSVGDRERNTRNVRMATVEDRTAEAAERCRSLGAETRFERNPGGHFQDVAVRIARGVDFIL